MRFLRRFAPRNDRGGARSVLVFYFITDTLSLFLPPHPIPLPPRGEGIFASHPVFRSASQIQEIKYKEKDTSCKFRKFFSLILEAADFYLLFFCDIIKY